MGTCHTQHRRRSGPRPHLSLGSSHRRTSGRPGRPRTLRPRHPHTLGHPKLLSGPGCGRRRITIVKGGPFLALVLNSRGQNPSSTTRSSGRPPTCVVFLCCFRDVYSCVCSILSVFLRLYAIDAPALCVCAPLTPSMRCRNTKAPRGTTRTPHQNGAENSGSFCTVKPQSVRFWRSYASANFE